MSDRYSDAWSSECANTGEKWLRSDEGRRIAENDLIGRAVSADERIQLIIAQLQDAVASLGVDHGANAALRALAVTLTLRKQVADIERALGLFQRAGQALAASLAEGNAK
jgi:hypothetical protein